MGKVLSFEEGRFCGDFLVEGEGRGGWLLNELWGKGGRVYRLFPE